MKKFSYIIFGIFVSLLCPGVINSAESDTNALLPLSSLAIPQSLGKIQERFEGQGNRTIVQIQDVHAHVPAQENIAAIVEHLRAVCDIKTVALEGAWTSTSLPKSRAVSTSREKQLLARSLLEEDLISGPLYAALLSPSPIELNGVEDASLYEENRKLYLEHAAAKSSLVPKIETYRERLHNEARGLWSAELFAFGSAYGKSFRASDFKDFFEVLFKTADARQIPSGDLEQVVLLRQILRLEKTLSREKLETEIKHLMREYKNTSWNFEELLRSGSIGSEKYGIFPEIKKFRELTSLRDKLVLQDLMTQIDVLTARALEQLIRNPAENALWGKIGRFYLAEKILLLQAVPSDLQRAESDKTALEALLREAGLTEAFALSSSFYELVKKRDVIFFDKLMSDPVLTGSVAIVTGGFHTAGLSQKLRETGISYIVIAPELNGEAMNEELYEKRMKAGGTRKMDDEKQKTKNLSSSAIPHPTSSTLSELQNATARLDEQFEDAYRVLLQTKNVMKAVAAFLGNSPSVSAQEKVSHLRATGKILPAVPAKGSLSTSSLRESEFMALNREEQMVAVRGWLEKSRMVHGKSLLVSQVSSLKKMLSEKRVRDLVEEMIRNNDTLVLVQDVPIAEVPESLLVPRGVERFAVKDLDALLAQTPKFKRLAAKHPFAIMKDGYRHDTYIVLPEVPASLILYRIVALNPDLYRAARNPEFLRLLQALVTEILGQELTQKAA